MFLLMGFVETKDEKLDSRHKQLLEDAYRTRANAYKSLKGYVSKSGDAVVFEFGTRTDPIAMICDSRRYASAAHPPSQ